MNLLNAAGQASQVIGFILLLVTSIAAFGKFFIFDPLRREIQEATRPIQPSANGGLSLPDVAKKLDVPIRFLENAIKIGLIKTTRDDLI